MDFENRILLGNSLDVLESLPDNSVDCCVTSPPYYGLRDYGVADQIGLEKSPSQYIKKLVEIFHEVKRLLKDDGTLWVNIGDSYNGYKGNAVSMSNGSEYAGFRDQPTRPGGYGLECKDMKPKDLMGIPWKLAFALQDDDWWLRQDIIWHKPNPMPESVTDRCTKAHEYIFLLAKSNKYYFDHEAIMEVAAYDGRKDTRMKGSHKYSQTNTTGLPPQTFSARGHERWQRGDDGSFLRNKRDVWTVNTKPYKDAHFAVFPPELILPCILAGCKEGGIVLDPFMGSGTTAIVALHLSRKFVGCEINPEYVKLAENRISEELGMFA